MRKWIIISASLLPMFFIGCTEHSLDSESLSKEDVLINFSAGYTVDYGVDVVPEEWQALSGVRSRATVAAKEYRLGIVGVAATEDDAYADCLRGLDGDSFCYNMYNAEYKVKLDSEGNFTGGVTPVDKVPRSFPIEERSAVAVYSYLPYSRNIEVGDTSCYVRLDLFSENMLTDYLYTGKIFRAKRGFGKDDCIALDYKHAFAKVCLSFVADKYVYIDSLQMGTGVNGTGLFDLKNGHFYPDSPVGDDVSCSFDINKVRNDFNSGTTKESYTELYIPPTMPLKDMKIVYRLRGGTKTVTRTLTFDKELNFERGREYSISVKLNVSSEIYD